MRILITNDDGLNAEQLLPLIRWCQKLGEVTAFVPKVEQSGKSHSFEIRKLFEAKQVELEPGVTVWSVDSTPADCVRLAVLGLGLQFDLVVSGVNRGLNLGRDIMYSGTVGAASEAVNLGIKAIALSTPPEAYDRATAHLDTVWDFFQTHDLLSRNDIYNVNIPAEPIGIRITRQGGPYYSDDFPHIGNDLYRPTGKPIWEDSHDDTLDTDATFHGYITVTPLTIDRTNWEVFRKLEGLNR
ncbi:MAG: 5'/3'-nucleotidase SurE [Oscillospiraceae bacterium]|nr:5'/3'-nucleotidase SurE [Oscillospiraceae bacterium]